MKPVIKIFGLPLSDRYCDKIRTAIARTVVNMGIGVGNKDDVIIFMPTDKHLSDNIVIEIDAENHNHAKKFEAIICFIKEIYPKAYVQGKISYDFNLMRSSDIKCLP